MAEKMTSINPTVLIWCRKVSGVSLDEAGKKFGQEKIENWENGTDYPTYNQLQQLCDFYRKPVAICFFPEPPEYKSLSTSFRTIPANMEALLLNRRIIKLLDGARTMQLNLYELKKDNYAYSHFSSLEFSPKVTIMAQELRKILHGNLSLQKKISSGSEQFEFWREKISEIGIFVFKEAFGEDSTSGFCLYDDVFPVIYINNSLSFTRQLFTLFHELCHIIYKTSGIDILNDSFYHSNLEGFSLNVERSCNAFAGAFLVPDNDFTKAIDGKRPTEEFVSKLASTYSVSREVILRKFLDIQWISQDEYTERSAQYMADYFRIKSADKAKKSSGNYYNTQAAYKGKQYTELVFRSYYSSQINLTQAAQYMNMKIPSIRLFAEKRGWGSL